MRKIHLMVFPLLLVVFLACGCAENRDADAMCKFDCDSVINLKIGTASSADAVAYAPLLTNTLIQNIIIDYDKTIISYEVATGRIEALRSGSTRIKCTVNDKTKSVLVNVEQAVYCALLECFDCVMEYGKTADLLSASRNTFKTNTYYNMGYTFESLTPDVLSVDASGVVTAKAVGAGQIQVVVLTGVNRNSATQYDTLSKTINIVVMERRNDLSLSIFNNDLTQEIESEVDENGVKCYTLYSSADGSISYNLKITSDQSLKNRFICESTTIADCVNYHQYSENDRLIVQDNNYIISKDEKTMYQTFRLVDCGTDTIQKEILDSGLNFFYKSLSEKINLRVYEQASSSDISTKVLSASGDKEYENISTYGSYCLYKSEDGDNPIVYVDVDISEYCNPQYEYSAQNLTVTKADNGMLAVSFGESVGEGLLTISSADGGGAKKVISFYNYGKIVTIFPEAERYNYLYWEDGYAYFVKNFKVYDEDGNLLENYEIEVSIVDKDGYTVTDKARIYYQDVLYQSFAITFAGLGDETVKYDIVLHAKDTLYYSNVLTVYIYPKNSLTN